MNRIQKEDYQIIAKTMSFFKNISLRLDFIGEDHTKVSPPKILNNKLIKLFSIH